MRILHYLSVIRAEVGGPARAVVDLCAALARAGHEITVVTTDDTDAPKDWAGPTQPGRPRLIRVDPPTIPGGLFTRAGLAPLRAMIQGHDVLHLHGVWGPWSWQLGALARRVDRPYIISVRGMLDDWCMEQKAVKKRLFLAVAVRRWLERASFVHLTAQAEFDQARKHFPRGRGIVISNLTDLKPFENLPGPGVARAKFPVLASGRPNLLFLSRVHVKKGLEVLLRAGALLRERGVDVNILIAGSGEAPYVDSLKRLATELGLDSRAHFLGLVVNDEKLSLYQACDLFVLPTSQENFGFVFIESLACGTPVVTTRGVDIWPELEASGGSVIADATPDAVADAVGGLLARSESLGAMGAKGREWVFRDMSPAKVIREFEGMYERARGKALGTGH